jgi:hypothetical protein
MNLRISSRFIFGNRVWSVSSGCPGWFAGAGDCAGTDPDPSAFAGAGFFSVVVVVSGLFSGSGFFPAASRPFAAGFFPAGRVGFVFMTVPAPTSELSLTGPAPFASGIPSLSSSMIPPCAPGRTEPELARDGRGRCNKAEIADDLCVVVQDVLRHAAQFYQPHGADKADDPRAHDREIADISFSVLVAL